MAQTIVLIRTTSSVLPLNGLYSLVEWPIFATFILEMYKCVIIPSSCYGQVLVLLSGPTTHSWSCTPSRHITCLGATMSISYTFLLQLYTKLPEMLNFVSFSSMMKALHATIWQGGRKDRCRPSQSISMYGPKPTTRKGMTEH